MNKSLRSLAFALALAAVSLLGAAAAHAQTVITSVPYVVNTSGEYVLNNNLNSSLAGTVLIPVNASNVTIDFQNHYIAGPVGNTTQNTIGINANEQSNLTVKNGTIAYCKVGIQIAGNGSATTNSVGHIVENMRVTYCYYNGIYLSASPASRISNCLISQTGYSGLTTGFGIVAGSGATVAGNAVTTVTATNAYGILASTGSFIRQNTISNCVTGVSGGKYQDNLMANCTNAYNAGTDAGGNN